jgi:hypothetical protein
VKSCEPSRAWSPPWDNLFVAPVAGASSHINLISNHGYMVKANNPSAGGYINGFLDDRGAGRPPLGAIHFCGDYTAEPGLPGASGSGHYTGTAVADALAPRAVQTTSRHVA